MAGYGAAAASKTQPALIDGPVFEPLPYVQRTLALFEQARKELGNEIELLHDVHERVTPRMAVQFAKDMEKFRLFFLEDALAPEDINYFRQIRAQCSTPLAMGELFNNPNEWTPLIKEQLIDYIRCHVSQVGGLTPARSLASLAEQCQVRTAWHGPGDTSPIGHAANITLDLVCPNFGVQEWSPSNDRILEVFSGYPEMRDGYIYANERPGWGIEVDEKAAAKYPFGSGESDERKRLNGGWGEVRRRDGSVIQQ
jgi:mannonate dehydratase